MFKGSAHVGKAEHISLVQAAGGTMNGTTWLDRTNYFETMPSHQLELALWLEADRMGTLTEALSQENLDNQREVVKNEKRWSYDNRPYGTWNEKLQAHLYPDEHPYHHPTIGSMDDLDAASVDDVKAFFRTYYAPNNAVLAIVGDADPAEVRRWVERYFGAIPANPAIPPLGDLSLPPTLGGERRETVEDRIPLPRIYFGFRAPAFGDTRLDALEVASQILAGGKGAVYPAARSRGRAWPRTSPSSARVHRRRVDCGRLGHRPAGRPISRVEGVRYEENRPPPPTCPSDDELPARRP
jgi:predicted Zn-dependent peptidase